MSGGASREPKPPVRGIRSPLSRRVGGGPQGSAWAAPGLGGEGSGLGGEGPTPSTPSNVWKMYLVRMLFWTHLFSSVLIPFYRDWGGLDFKRILLLNAWFMVWNFLLEVPTGAVADFWGRKASVALACLVAGIGTVVYVWQPSIAFFMVAEVLFAAGMTLLSGADEALVYDSLREETGDGPSLTERAKRAMARLESFKLGGIVLGALVGSVIAARWGLSMPMRLQGLPLLAGFLVALTLREPRTAAPGTTESKRPYRQVIWDGVRYFMGHAVLRVLALDMIVMAALGFMIIWLYQPFLDRSGIGLAWFGTVHSLMCVSQILILSQVAWLERLVGSQKRLLWATAILTGVAFLALGGFGAKAPVVAAILVAAGFGLSRPVLFSAYFNQHIPSEKRATVLSTVSMFRMLGIALVNPLVGVLADVSLTLTALVLGGVIVLVASFSRIREEHLGASV